MHRNRRTILIVAAVLALLAGDAYAQSVGVGLGVDDLHPVGVTGSAPVATFVLLNQGGKITLNQTGSVQCNAC